MPNVSVKGYCMKCPELSWLKNFAENHNYQKNLAADFSASARSFRGTG